MTSPVPFTPPQAAGLPIRKGAAHFAIGAPDGISSNCWKFFTTKSGIYLVCRDNFKEVKISLHTSGTWRMGFTEHAVQERPGLVNPNTGDRVWDKWQEPMEIKPGVVVAFRVAFPTSELAVELEARDPSKWKGTYFFEAGPLGSGMMTVATVLLTQEDGPVTYEDHPSVHVASLPLVDGRRAQLVVHADPENDIHEVIGNAKTQSFTMMPAAGVPVPETGYIYFHGVHGDGVRFFVGARATPVD